MKRWKSIVLLGIALLSFVGFLLLRYSDRRCIVQLPAMNAAERWETAEKPYNEATVFLEEAGSIPQSALPDIQRGLEQAMKAAGADPETHKWIYAASRKQMTELKNGTAGIQVELTEVLGDYFTIHPMPLRSGWYMCETDIMHDRIILDRQTAWDLFYSDQVVGQTVTWNGQDYVIAAVVDEESGKYNELAAGKTRRGWIYADSPASDQARGFTTFEAVIPQPVSGFAATTLLSVLDAYIPPETAVVDGELRFGLPHRAQVLHTLPVRGISSMAIPYPYWENAARLTENHLAVMLIPEGILLLISLVILAYFLWRLNRKRTWGLHSIREAVENAIEKKRIRDYEKRSGSHR